MIQPDVAGAFLTNTALRDQGLLSRILVAYPKSLAGARIYKAPTKDDNKEIRAFATRILYILEAPLSLALSKRNELDPPALPLSDEAQLSWIEFHDHVEKQCVGELAPIKDFVAKAAEHAARIAGVITIIGDLHAKEISADAMANGISLLDWYISEASCIQRISIISDELRHADALLKWLQEQPGAVASFREILRLGPNATKQSPRLSAPLMFLQNINSCLQRQQDHTS